MQYTRDCSRRAKFCRVVDGRCCKLLCRLSRTSNQSSEVSCVRARAPSQWPRASRGGARRERGVARRSRSGVTLAGWRWKVRDGSATPAALDAADAVREPKIRSRRFPSFRLHPHISVGAGPSNPTRLLDLQGCTQYATINEPRARAFTRARVRFRWPHPPDFPLTSTLTFPRRPPRRPPPAPRTGRVPDKSLRGMFVPCRALTGARVPP